MSYQVESQAKLPDKPRGLMNRAQAAMAHMPQSTAHQYGLALAVDRSQKYMYAADEMVHGFARSRSSPDNIVHNVRMEGAVVPLHYPTQRPMEAAFSQRSARAAQFDQMAPVGCGAQCARTW